MNNNTQENIYGHKKRLDWIQSHITTNDSLLEFGCGTGNMISFPLAQLGYQIRGVDLDCKSINFGKSIFKENGLDPNVLKAENLEKLSFTPDTIIASEVLEHIPDEDLLNTLSLIRKKLKKGGRLLVTVPNGYGWFEMESFLWFKAKIGKVFETLRLDRTIGKLKKMIFGSYFEDSIPSSLADSPHVQRFTYSSIKRILEKQGFEVNEIIGSVLFAGPFSNLFFTGINPVMKLNLKLGERYPKFASGFFVSCQAV